MSQKKMSEHSESLINPITELLRSGLTFRAACRSLGVSNGTRCFLKKYMDNNGMQTSKCIPLPKGSKAKHDEFDPIIFKQRVQSFISANRMYSGDKTTYVFTSALNDSEVDKDFLFTLENYCKVKDAELFITPLRYANPTNSLAFASSKDLTWDPVIKKYSCKKEIEFNKFRFLGNLNISATNSNPTSAFHAISQGDTLFIPHPRVHSEALPVLNGRLPAIIATTGCITKPCYSDSKAGYAANFNHSLAAIVVEQDGDVFHYRHLEWDGKGFYDIGVYFNGKWITKNVDSVRALYMGDTHARFMDPKVSAATFTDSDSILKVLKPKIGIWGDLVDSHSVSHHHGKMPFTQYAKFISKKDSIQEEVEESLDTIGLFELDLIQPSNHNDHILKYLETADIRLDYVNKRFYHLMNYLMLDGTTMGPGGAEYPNPLELYANIYLSEDKMKTIKFMSRSTSYMICGIEVSCHGDIGTNGSRGSRMQYSKLPDKCIIGHSHSPGINGGCYQVGTSSLLRMEYNAGPSSWLQTHCLIYDNGKRQLINLIDGKWRR